MKTDRRLQNPASVHHENYRRLGRSGLFPLVFHWKIHLSFPQAIIVNLGNKVKINKNKKKTTNKRRRRGKAKKKKRQHARAHAHSITQQTLRNYCIAHGCLSAVRWSNYAGAKYPQHVLFA